MRLPGWLGRLFGRTEGDELVTLVIVAREDPVVRQQLHLILAQEDFHRRSLLNSWVRDLRFQGAPPELLRALEMLTDDDCAHRARTLLNAPP